MKRNYGINSIVKNLRFLMFVGGSLLVFSIAVTAQNYPEEIRGYKVYRAKISVKNQIEETAAKDKSETLVKVGEPVIIDVSLTQITFELSAEIDSIQESGTVNFLTFEDFRVNGLKVDVEEYRQSFAFKKNRLITLPKPFKIFIGAGQTLRAALKDVQESKDEWTVTGKVFVFGQFKKSIFNSTNMINILLHQKQASK